MTDGSSYAGTYKAGKKHGHGTSKWTNGNTYVGFYEDNEMHGVGIYTWADGSKYAGEWKDGVRWSGAGYLPSGEVKGTYLDGVFKHAN